MDAEGTAPQRFAQRDSAPPTRREVEGFLESEDVRLIPCRDGAQLFVRGDADARELGINWCASVIASHRTELVRGPALHLVGAARWTWLARLLDDER
jgi:hypothetical protein